MSCDELKRLFDANPRSQDFAEKVDNICPNCQCEMKSVTAFSQENPVQNGEVLLKIITSDELTGEGLERAFLPLIGIGLSVLRERTATSDEIRNLAQEIARKRADKRPNTETVEVWGVIRFKAAKVRERYLSGENKDRRAFCIYETPEPTYQSHADVLLAAACISGKNKRKREAFNLALTLEREKCSVPASEYDRADLSGISFQGAIADA
jgi:hypothetical protein